MIPTKEELIKFARYAESKQPEALEMIERAGFIFDKSGGSWEKLAFTLYSDLCEINLKARQLFEE